MRRTTPALFALIGMAALPAQAGTITVDWPVRLTLTTGDGPSQIDPFTTNHEISTRIQKEVNVPIVGTTLARLDLQAGMSFPTRHIDTFSMDLPFRVSITAPDTARAGSQITLRPSISLFGTPRFELNGSAEFDTTVYARGEGFLPILGTKRFDTGVVNLPDAVRLSAGSGLTFGGDGTYSDSTTDARDRLIGPFARAVPVDPRFGSVSGRPFAALDDRFRGIEMSVEGRMDAWRGELNIWEPLKSVPVIGAAAGVADFLSDLDLRLGADLLDRATLTTGVLYGLFSDDDGASFRAPVPLNGAFIDGVAVRIPTAATGQYELEFGGFGLGFGLVQQALMQANLDLVLDGTNPLPSWRILSVDFGGPFDLGRQLTRFSYFDFLGDAFSNPPIDAASRTLLIDILATAPLNPPPGVVDPGLQPGIVTAVNDSLGGTGDRFTLPSTGPTGGAVELPTSVPEPGGLALLAAGLLVMIGTKRGRIARSPSA